MRHPQPARQQSILLPFPFFSGYGGGAPGDTNPVHALVYEYGRRMERK